MKNIKYNKIRTYFKLNIGIVIILSLTSLMFNISIAYVPTLQGYLIDAFNTSEPFKDIMLLILYYLCLVIFAQVNRFIKRYCRRIFSNKMTLQMRTKAFSNLLLCDINGFQFSTYGDIMNRQLADIRDACEAIETLFAEIFDSGVLLISYFVFMYLMSPKLTIICFPILVLIIILSKFIGKYVKKSNIEYRNVYSNAKRENLNVLQNEIYYRGFGINKNYYDRYEQVLDDVEKKAVKNTVFRTCFEPVYLAIASIGYVFVLYYGGLKVINGTWMLGTLTAFMTSFTPARKKCGFLGRIINHVENGFVSWDRCKDYLDTKIILKETNLVNNNGLIVDNLSFGYDENFKLHDISFKANYGEIIGVCGKIRSGKTTLAGALSGVYDYGGSITLCGLELKNIRNDNVRSFINYAPGKVEIFNDTLEYNINFGLDGDFEKAINTACLKVDIDMFPNGKNEILSHSLLNISGGQQRRLQIARCVYTSPKMVILDDPFNAIGIKQSIDIINNLKNNYKETIFIIINNQKETLKLFDNILFLDDNTSYFNNYNELLKNDNFNKLMGGDL